LGCAIKQSVENKDFLCSGDFSFVSFLFVVEKEKKKQKSTLKRILRFLKRARKHSARMFFLKTGFVTDVCALSGGN
jgi:hypothetical protein